MRDGTVLRADIHRPPHGCGPWPVLLARCPYGRRDPGILARLAPATAARHGWLVVIQDTRGRFGSDGDWEPLAHEYDDGHDSVRWAAGLPGGDGRVAMYGPSYLGHAQWAAIEAAPPELIAAVPEFTWADPYDGLLSRGGARELGLTLQWTLGLGRDVLRRRYAADPARRRAALAELASTDAELVAGRWDLTAPSALGLPVPGRRGSPPPRAVPTDHTALPPVATLTVAGWYDAFLQGSIDNYSRARAAGRRTALIIGPWTHDNQSGRAGPPAFGRDFDFGPHADSAHIDAQGSLLEHQLDWLATTLRRPRVPGAAAGDERGAGAGAGAGPGRRGGGGIGGSGSGAGIRGRAAVRAPGAGEAATGERAGTDGGVEPGARTLDASGTGGGVRGAWAGWKGDGGALVFVTGVNRWQEFGAWPPPGAAAEWYLHGDGRLSASRPRQGRGPGRSFRHDPADPVPVLGGALLLTDRYPAGPADQRPIEARPDVLVHTSAPLKRPLEIAGRIVAVLTVASTAPTATWVVRLCDVAPDGTSTNLTDGIARTPRPPGEAARADPRDPARAPDLARAPGRPRALDLRRGLDLRRAPGPPGAGVPAGTVVTVDLWSVHHVFRAGHALRVDVAATSWPRWEPEPAPGTQTVLAGRSRLVLPVVPRRPSGKVGRLEPP
jgi:predicted acyl esterase